MDIQKVLSELEVFRGTFPHKALKDAVDNREQIIPELLNILDYAAKNTDKLLEEPDYMAHMYAMYLLAQFREKRAYPLLITFFSIPGDVSVDLTGDLVTEDLDRILASVSGGDTGPMMALIENENVNEWVRDAALRGLVVLVAHGVKSREEILSYFQSLFREKLPRTDSMVWNCLVSASADLYPDMVYGDIKQAYEDDLVDPMYIALDDVEKTLTLEKDAVLAQLRRDPRYAYIDSTIKELKGWAGFQPDEPHRSGTRSATKQKKIGRNDPCPCGSGLKYKRCHGKRQQV